MTSAATPPTTLRPLDRLAFRWITRGWPANRITTYAKALRVEDEQSPIPNVIARTFENLDAKSTGLLTHTGMMVAALGVSATVVATSDIERGVIIVEIMIYLLIAVVCLRCISAFQEPPDYDDATLTVAVQEELILRNGLYVLSNRVTIYLTILVFFSLPILLLI